MSAFVSAGQRVAIRRPTEADRDEFLAMVRASGDFHHPWVDPPATADRFGEYLKSRQAPGDDGFFICAREYGAIMGVVNLNCIVRRLFQSAYLGYYIGAAFAGRGYMTEGIELVAKHAFSEMGLHRLEANIQPENLASIALVKKCGFRKEGYSPRYLKIAGEWRDHERWALLADDLKP
jgi:ribosomal-protein-alanine N-acetyltransferase